ncbi:MAG: ATP-binding cassette domain-containing protein, partial [Myxococcales bacterium]|nr:ATP-binding cassette domain-containing protein [Myxococcales bacterium]
MAAESTPSTQEILAGQLEAGPTPLLVRELSVRVAGRTLLRDVDIELRRGELVALVGHSGSGKSVLLRIIAGLIRGDESGFEISGELLIASQDGFARRRPSVGVVFQRFALFDELTPEENLAFALSHRDRRATRAERERVHELAVSLGIHDLPAIAHCSIGQQQRIALLRAIAFDPPLIVFDEPTSGLDPRTTKEVVELIRRTAKEQGKTALVVTHDYDDLLPVADRVLLLDSREQTIRPVGASEVATYMAGPRQAADVGAPREALTASGGATSPSAALAEPDLVVASPQPVLPPAGLARFLAYLRWIVVGWFWRVGQLVEELVVGLFYLVPRWRSLRWGAGYFWHYLRLTSFVPTLLYLTAAGAIAGFAATYFTFRYFPYQQLTEPLLMDDVLASLGFALFRVVVPVIACLLLAARNGAAIASDVGSRSYTNALDAMRSMQAPPRRYLLSGVLWATMLGAPICVFVSFEAAKLASLATFDWLYPQHSVFYWDAGFHYFLRGAQRTYDGSALFLGKTLLAGYLIAVRG